VHRTTFLDGLNCRSRSGGGDTKVLIHQITREDGRFAQLIESMPRAILCAKSPPSLREGRARAATPDATVQNQRNESRLFIDNCPFTPSWPSRARGTRGDLRGKRRGLAAAMAAAQNSRRAKRR